MTAGLPSPRFGTDGGRSTRLGSNSSAPLYLRGLLYATHTIRMSSPSPDLALGDQKNVWSPCTKFKLPCTLYQPLKHDRVFHVGLATTRVCSARIFSVWTTAAPTRGSTLMQHSVAQLAVLGLQPLSRACGPCKTTAPAQAAAWAAWPVARSGRSRSRPAARRSRGRSPCSAARRVPGS